MAHIAAVRQSRNLKLPDAILMASAAAHQATVITNDIQLLQFGVNDAGFVALGFAFDG